MRSPGRTVKETSWSVGGPPRCPKPTWSSSIPPRVASTGDGVGRVGDAGLHVEQLEDPLGAGAGLLGRRHQAGHEAHRRDDLHEVAGEREEHAEREVAAQGEPAAERQHAELGEHRQHLQRGRVAAVVAGRAHARLVELVGPVGEAVELALLLGERLDDAHAVDGLVDDAGDGAGEALVVPGRREHAVAEADGHEREDRDEHDDDDAEHGRQDEHHDEGDDEQRHVGDEHRDGEEERLDQREVAGRHGT